MLSELAVARNRECVDLAERERRPACEIEALIEAREAAAAPRRGAHAGVRHVVSATAIAAPGNASLPSRWSKSACVASRPLTGNPDCSATAGSSSSSSGRIGESITKPSAPLFTNVQVVRHDTLSTTTTSSCSAVARINPARADPRRDRRQTIPSSFAASRRFATSAVGLRWPASSVSLWRLTQITGIFSFTHGSTSW